MKTSIVYPSPDLVARQFCRILNEWLSPAEMDEVLRLNAAEPTHAICHTHDFCDPNQAMLDAFTACGHDCSDGADADLQADEFLRIWADAWTMARNASFNLP